MLNFHLPPCDGIVADVAQVPATQVQINPGQLELCIPVPDTKEFRLRARNPDEKVYDLMVYKDDGTPVDSDDAAAIATTVGWICYRFHYDETITEPVDLTRQYK